MKGVLFPDVCLAWSVEKEHQHSHYGRKAHLLPFLHKRKDTLCNRKGGGGGEGRIKGKGKMKSEEGHKEGRK